MASEASLTATPSDAGSSCEHPKGYMWVQGVYRGVDFERFEHDTRYRQYMAKIPQSIGRKSLLYPIYQLFATCDVSIVSRLLGISDCPDTEFTRLTIQQHCQKICTRGNVNGRKLDRMKTNDNLLRRQFDFLEYLCDHAELRTTFDDLCSMVKRQKDDTLNYTWEPATEHFLVCEEAAISYLKAKNVEKAAKYSARANDSIVQEPEEGQALDISTIDVGIREGRRATKIKRQERAYLGEADAKCYRAAMSELHKIQLKILGIEGMCPLLTSQTNFNTFMSTFVKTVKHATICDTLDKSYGTIATQPSRAQIRQLLDLWIGRETHDEHRVHSGLTDAAAFLSMAYGGLLRADSMYRIHYSDLELITHSHFARVDVLFDVPYFLCRARESKTNSDGALTYNVKIPNLDPLRCPVAAEGMLLALRHDVMKVPINNYTTVVPSSKGEYHRTWHDDVLFCKIFDAGAPETYTYDGIEYGGVDKHLKEPLNLNTVSRGWRNAFVEVEIDSAHTLHMGRSLQSLVNGFLGISIEETGRMGHWTVYNDTLGLCYALLADAETLCKVAGARNYDSYRPFWAMIRPPEELSRLVLAAYIDELDPAVQRLRDSRMTMDPTAKLLLQDMQAINTIKYMRQLAVVVVQCAPYFREKHGDHILVKRHPLFSHPCFDLWSKTARLFARTMAELDVQASEAFAGVSAISFHTMFDGERVRVRPRSDAEGEAAEYRAMAIFDDMCGRLEQSVVPDVDRPRFNFMQTEQMSIGSPAAMPREDLLTEVKSSMIFTGLRKDIFQLRRSVQRLVIGTQQDGGRKRVRLSCQTGGSESNSRSAGSPGNEMRMAKPARDPEITSLPTLTVLDKYDRPVKQVCDLWWNGSSDMKPIKHLVENSGPNAKVSECRTIAERVKRLRYISVVVEVLMESRKLSSDEAIRELEAYKKNKKISLNKLADTIRMDLSKQKVLGGSKMEAANVLSSNNFRPDQFDWLKPQ